MTRRDKPSCVDTPPTSSAAASGCQLIGDSPAMHEIRCMVARLGSGDAKILITGESGVGKDVVARHVHALSRRAEHPMIAVNCAGVTESLLEAELFGHVKGSFTGAFRDKIGKLQAAHRGTIFLDEVGEMSSRMQALLLRFLESGEIQPVGSDGAPRLVDVRVIAATNRDLMALVAEGRFREDLVYRLNVIHIEVPPLRERRSDIPALIAFLCRRAGKALTFSVDAQRALQVYHWPGNVRELQNTIERLIWTVSGGECQVADLPRPIRLNAGAAPSVTPARERRRQIADHLYDGLVTAQYSFWSQVYPLFLQRDITRHDLRTLVGRGLVTTCGNYRALLTLFGMPQNDYKRFQNFLAAHGCRVDFRTFRGRTQSDAARVPAVEELVKPELRAP